MLAILSMTIKADDESDDGKITVFAPHTEYFKAKQALTVFETFGEIVFDVDEIQFLPKGK